MSDDVNFAEENAALGLQILSARRLVANSPEDEEAAAALARLQARLVDGNLGLVRTAARKWGHNRDLREDYEAAGTAALVESAHTWDPEMSAFASWAKPAIDRAVRKAVRFFEFPHLSSRQFDERGRLRAARDAFRARSGREPSHAELSAEAGVDPETVAFLMDGPGLMQLGPGDDLAVDGPDPFRGLKDDEVKGLLMACMDAAELDHLEYSVVYWRHGLGGEGRESTRQVGRSLGISKERVRQIDKRALSKIRRVLRSAGIDRDILPE